jgi:anti-sigma28 factor (negative regulator of flagellin synthesis)
MVDRPEDRIPRLDPMASPKERVDFVLALKAAIDVGDYSVAVEEVARAVLEDLVLFRR